jgi:4-diphosphocytidyl-2-C-methyl-D-erythritol kinase
MINKLIIEAPAKINLTLDIKGKRADGYHELETVMHQINLTDKIYLEKQNGLLSLDSNNKLLPLDSNNLAYRAAELMLDRYGSGEGVSIYIEKNIPVGAGLAGGSTDAAAVIKGLNILYGYHCSDQELAGIAALIGSDVPFCLQGNPVIILEDDQGIQKVFNNRVTGTTVVARGRGEILTPMVNRHLPWILIVKPAFSLSTADVYRAYRMDYVHKHPDFNSFNKSWNLYDIIGISKSCVNVLETVSTERYPEINEIKSNLEKMGAIKACMSGSGPSVFAVFNNNNLAVEAEYRFKQRYIETYLVSSYGRGD